MIPLSFNCSNFCNKSQDLLKNKRSPHMGISQPFPTSWSSFGIRNNYLKSKDIILKDNYFIFFWKTAPLIRTCAYKQKSSSRTKHDLFFYKLACTPCSSIHVLTCGSLFRMVHHSALGALWKWAFQVHALRIPEVSGNLPFAFARGLKRERAGAAYHCCAIHYGTKKCLGLGRQATNDPSFCPETIKIDT